MALALSFGASKLVGQAQGWLNQAPQALRKVSEMIPTGSGPFVDFLKVQEAVDELTNAPDDPKPVTVELRSQAGAIAALGMGGY